MQKIMTLSTPFLNELFELYNKHRDPQTQLKTTKFLRLLRRSRAENLKFGQFHLNNSDPEVVDLTSEKQSENMTNFYERFFQFRLVVLFFSNYESKQIEQIPRLFWIPADLSFMELNPLLSFFYNKCVEMKKIDDFEVVEKKILSQEGEYDFQDCASNFLSDNLDEDNIIKIVFLLK